MTFSWLCCPSCRRELAVGADGATCANCRSTYPKVGPILDLRLPGASWIDRERDRKTALRLLAMPANTPARELLESVFRNREGWTDTQIRDRVGQVLDGIPRLRRELSGWLRPCLQVGGPILDLGCGAGQCVTALMMERREVVGVDVSLTWLAVADRLARELAGPPFLVAALAEALPFPDASLGAVVSLDVLEHVGDQSAYLREIDRLLRPGGYAALTTPNRFSAAAEPHVGLWGVGWLPRRWQRTYVRLRRAPSYDYVRLLSYRGIQTQFRRDTSLEATILVPPIPEEDVRRYRGRRARLAQVYNRLLALAPMRAMFCVFGPFFRILARKPGMSPWTEPHP